MDSSAASASAHLVRTRAARPLRPARAARALRPRICGNSAALRRQASSYSAPLFDRCAVLTAAGFCIMLLFAYLYTQFSLFDSPGFQASFHAVRCVLARGVSTALASDCAVACAGLACLRWPCARCSRSRSTRWLTSASTRRRLRRCCFGWRPSACCSRCSARRSSSASPSRAWSTCCTKGASGR